MRRKRVPKTCAEFPSQFHCTLNAFLGATATDVKVQMLPTAAYCSLIFKNVKNISIAQLLPKLEAFL